MDIYETYIKLNINGSCIGLENGEDTSDYFCTPEGASIIGWAGVDGVHFCFVRGFGEMVFSVSPMNAPDNYVQPLARDFKDFLRLLLACGDTAALEQAWLWDWEQFNEFLQENTPTKEQTVALHIIQEACSLTPMEQPFDYIRALQDSFDYRQIPYAKAYYDTHPSEPSMPEWKVFFDGNFWGHDDLEEAGEEISINKQLIWEDELWTIPAIYFYEEGLVVDFCMQVPPERIRSFVDKWNLSIDNDGSAFTEEQRLCIDAENPLTCNINATVMLNGAELSSSHSCGLSWNPCFPDSNGFEARSVMRHYGLDHDQGYIVCRSAFPWKTKQKPQIDTLCVTMIKQPVAIPVTHFKVSLPGEETEFILPSTGQKHTLRVQEYEWQELSEELFKNPDLEFPRHCIVMSYTLSPELPKESLMIMDCNSGNRPHQKHIDSRASQEGGDVGARIIGGADSANAIFLIGTHDDNVHSACSALYFEAVEKVEWSIFSNEKQHKDITVELI